MFVDEVKIFVKAGDGGKGCVSFFRGKYQPRGGPDGGDGGDGGNIVIQVNSGVNTLLDLTYHRYNTARRGTHGRGNNQTGKRGDDLVLMVPPGTVVRDAETGEFLADLVSPGETFIAARGGRGGRGNSAFATAVNQAPQYAQPGEAGEERWLYLELKVLADIGLIGFPNTGKSTLISRISEAHPKIAAYPFTTLRPHLGVVSGPDFAKLVVADIPGLIEGAHQGIGLGIRFLKHIQRTRMLIHLVDLSPLSGRDVADDIAIINNEIKSFDMALKKKRQIIVGNKIDLAGSEDKRAALETYCRKKQIPFLAISAMTGEGVEELVEAMFALLKETSSEKVGK